MASTATRLNKANRTAFEHGFVEAWAHTDCHRSLKLLATLADDLAKCYAVNNIPANRELARIARDCRFLVQLKTTLLRTCE